MEYIVHMTVFASQSTLYSELYFVPMMYVLKWGGLFLYLFGCAVPCVLAAPEAP